MAGHSKWANIKHRKERADQKKGKIFSRAVKEIISAVKQGGPDLKSNGKLRIAVEKARDANVPNENIERNIKKASDPNTQDFLPFQYELYGFGGVGLIVVGLTDNKNRISSEIRIALNKCGGTQAQPGAVAFNFERKGVIEVEKSSMKEEDLFLLVSDNGAEEMEVEEESYRIITPAEALAQVKDAIVNQAGKVLEAEIAMLPKVWVEPSEEEITSNLALIEKLEAIDDVDSVYHNIGKQQ
ncbi:MAG TPA: YebC/PmpR family DNA-binding transcriptional regulator [Chlamydiales bacterium]|nr:YebC/PmpR family DNA-binding transcriptional regulator [Chlamydiales bacterium]